MKRLTLLQDFAETTRRAKGFLQGANDVCVCGVCTWEIEAKANLWFDFPMAESDCLSLSCVCVCCSESEPIRIESASREIWERENYGIACQSVFSSTSFNFPTRLYIQKPLIRLDWLCNFSRTHSLSGLIAFRDPSMDLDIKIELRHCQLCIFGCKMCLFNYTFLSQRLRIPMM